MKYGTASRRLPFYVNVMVNLSYNTRNSRARKFTGSPSSVWTEANMVEKNTRTSMGLKKMVNPKKFSIKKPYLIAIVGSFFLCGYFPDSTLFEPSFNSFVVNGRLHTGYPCRLSIGDNVGFVWGIFFYSKFQKFVRNHAPPVEKCCRV